MRAVCGWGFRVKPGMRRKERPGMRRKEIAGQARDEGEEESAMRGKKSP